MQLVDVLQAVRWPVDTVVHCGAGLCKEFEAYERLRPRRVVLLEPHPDLAAQLGETYGHRLDVVVRNQALAANPGQATLHVNKVPRLSSLGQADRLEQVFPGAKASRTVEVACTDLAGLAREFQLSQGGNNVLVLEVMGLERQILAATQAEHLQAFRWVVSSEPEDGLFGHGAAQPMADSLEAAGFTWLSFGGAGEAFSIRHAVQDLVSEQLKSQLSERDRLVDDLRQQMTSLLEIQDAKSKELETQNATIERLRAEHAASEEALQSEVATLRESLSSADARVQAYEAREGELQERQRLLDEEVLKAEAQLELIKDVLLRDKAF